MDKFLSGFFATLIIIVIAAAAYFWGTKQANGPVSTSTPSPTKEQTVYEQETPTPTISKDEFVNPSATIESIKAAVESKNYAALEGYMAPSVSVVLYASECCGLLSGTKATQQLSYLTSGTSPWEFPITGPLINQLEVADPGNFKNAVIAIASNRYTAAFRLNNKFLIENIIMVADYKLLVP